MLRSATALLLFLVFSFSSTSYAQDAQVQGAYAGTDPTLAVIDIYFSVFGIPMEKYEDLEGGDATPFTEVPPGLTIEAGIAPATSSSISDVFASFPIAFEAGSINVAVGAGLREPSQFAPNPDGRDTALNLLVFDEARTAATSADVIDLAFFHGSTDTPGVRVAFSGETWVAQALYGDFSGYGSFAPGRYLFDVMDAATGTRLETFVADLPEALAGQAAVVSLLGFSDPAANQNGPMLRLTALLASGEAIEFPTHVPTHTATTDLPATAQLQPNYPNPFTETTTISYTLTVPSAVSVPIVNMLGQEVRTITPGLQSPGTYALPFEAGDLPAGVYLYTLQTETTRLTRRMIVLP